MCHNHRRPYKEHNLLVSKEIWFYALAQKDELGLIFVFLLTDNIEKQKTRIIHNVCNRLLFFEAFFSALKKIRFCSSANQTFCYHCPTCFQLNLVFIINLENMTIACLMVQFLPNLCC